MFSVPKLSYFDKIVLASASPRRSSILKQNGGLMDLVICPSTYEEESKGQFDPADVYSYITGIALGKVKQVAKLEKSKTENSAFNKTLFIGSDTVVLQDGKIFEKPKDRLDALSMLKGFRDRKNHQVCSGVVLLVANGKATGDDEFITHTFHETADVKFANVTDDILERYVETGEPMDKAGGYGIQGLGAQLVQSINGDYFNVMGFPLHKFCQELNKFIDILQTEAQRE